MRDYGQVQTAFWTNPDTRNLSDAGKLLAMYLITGPHSNGIGCYYLPNGYVMADLGWSSERVSKGFKELFRSGFIMRCEHTFFILIPKFLKWNQITNANVAKARQKEFESVPRKSAVFSKLCESMLKYGREFQPEFETTLKGFKKGFERVSNSEPYRTVQEPEQEPEKIMVDGKKPPSAKTELDEKFEQFWAAYPKRPEGNPKKPAREKFKSALKKADFETIMAGVEKYKASVAGKETKYIAHASTWLRNERWEEEYKKPVPPEISDWE